MSDGTIAVATVRVPDAVVFNGDLTLHKQGAWPIASSQDASSFHKLECMQTGNGYQATADGMYEYVHAGADDLGLMFTNAGIDIDKESSFIDIGQLTGLTYGNSCVADIQANDIIAMLPEYVAEE